MNKIRTFDEFLKEDQALTLSQKEFHYQFPDFTSKLNDSIRIELKGKAKINYENVSYRVNRTKRKTKKSKTQAISFFSGAGGLDIGAQLAGVQVISSLDFDADSVKTLHSNDFFAHAEHNCADITSAKAKDFSKVLKSNNPEKLIVIGGPPCQPFSKAGYWVTNKNRLGHEDPRNMIKQYLNLIDDLKPDGFLLENVESLLHPSNRIAVDYIGERLFKMGYNHEIVRANSVDYGVPQKRKRVFVVASSKKAISGEPTKTHGSEEERAVNKKLKPYEKVINWIGRYDTEKFYEVHEVSKGTYYSDLLKVPPGKNYIALTAAAGYKNPKFIAQKRFWSFLLKLHPLEPSWTIAAQPGPWVGPFHWTSRRLRVPEIAAIQTFPEDYVFYGSRRSVQKQIGNAVPPLLGKAMVHFLTDNI
ncbi:MAG: DNA cytosine methyltransferase [Bacteroidetes bacterium]|nr:DNA cytosine methyltransferase [Bacteroidota bacterium]